MNLYNNEAPRIAANIAKLPELLKRSQSTRHRKFHSVIPGLNKAARAHIATAAASLWCVHVQCLIILSRHVQHLRIHFAIFLVAECEGCAVTRDWYLRLVTFPRPD